MLERDTAAAQAEAEAEARVRASVARVKEIEAALEMAEAKEAQGGRSGIRAMQPARRASSMPVQSLRFNVGTGRRDLGKRAGWLGLGKLGARSGSKFEAQEQEKPKKEPIEAPTARTTPIAPSPSDEFRLSPGSGRAGLVRRQNLGDMVRRPRRRRSSPPAQAVVPASSTASSTPTGVELDAAALSAGPQRIGESNLGIASGDMEYTCTDASGREWSTCIPATPPQPDEPTADAEAGPSSPAGSFATSQLQPVLHARGVPMALGAQSHADCVGTPSAEARATISAAAHAFRPRRGTELSEVSHASPADDELAKHQAHREGGCAQLSEGDPGRRRIEALRYKYSDRQYGCSEPDALSSSARQTSTREQEGLPRGMGFNYISSSLAYSSATPPRSPEGAPPGSRDPSVEVTQPSVAADSWAARNQSDDGQELEPKPRQMMLSQAQQERENMVDDDDDAAVPAESRRNSIGSSSNSLGSSSLTARIIEMQRLRSPKGSPNRHRGTEDRARPGKLEGEVTPGVMEMVDTEMVSSDDPMADYAEYDWLDANELAALAAAAASVPLVAAATRTATGSTEIVPLFTAAGTTSRAAAPSVPSATARAPPLASPATDFEAFDPMTDYADFDDEDDEEDEELPYEMQPRKLREEVLPRTPAPVSPGHCVLLIADIQHRTPSIVELFRFCLA